MLHKARTVLDRKIQSRSPFHFNDFGTNKIGIDNLGASTVNAVDNWWNCPAGPGSNRCATVVGSGVASSPSLTSPFNSGYNVLLNNGHNEYR